MQKLGLNRPILRSGFLKFKAYNEKIKMMDTPLFLFGMKIHRHQFNVEFFDADFANTLLIESQTFTDKTLGECCKIIND
jgi:adenine-specific DNA methylase